MHAISQQAHALQKVVSNHRLEYIQLEIAGCATDIDCDIIAEHLAAQHRHRFALGRIDFAGHDGTAWFVFRNGDFAKTAARTRCQPAHIVGDLHQRRRQRLQHAMRSD